MKQTYKLKAINLIATTFNRYKIRYTVVNVHGKEKLSAVFPVEGGPSVMMNFIALSNNNDIAFRIFGLVTKVPSRKRSRVIEACNIINRKSFFTKVCLDIDGNVNVEYDFPVHTSDECLGEMAVEIAMRTLITLSSDYSILMKAIYSEEELEPSLPSDSHGLFNEVHDTPSLPVRPHNRFHGFGEEGTGPHVDIDAIISKIDAAMAELEAEETDDDDSDNFDIP